MEFIAITKVRDSLSPAGRREVLHVFSQWQPPEGLQLKSLHFSTNNDRTFSLWETDNAALMTQVTFEFADYLEIEWVPVLPAEEAAPIAGQAQAWVDQVKAG